MLINAEGVRVGIKTRQEALDLARQDGFDLVEIAPNASPPVCKIMDYDKYKYELNKKNKLSKKKQKVGTLKEVRLRPSTEKHDYEFKLNHIKRFTEIGHKVKVTVKFKGREFAHRELGQRILERISEDTADMCIVESKPKQEGKSYIMILSPKRKDGVAQDAKEKVT